MVVGRSTDSCTERHGPVLPWHSARPPSAWSQRRHCWPRRTDLIRDSRRPMATATKLRRRAKRTECAQPERAVVRGHLGTDASMLDLYRGDAGFVVALPSPIRTAIHLANPLTTVSLI